tara:strand:+ start:2799 stop:3311 length:513 start_codon:yes stop_codon:yes gene_type:complete
MAAVTTAVAAGVAAVATVGQAVVGYQKSKEQENTLETLEDKNKQKAADILTQIDAEQAILDEDLEALQKQSDFAVKKVLGQTTTQMDTTQDQITDALSGTFASRYGGGAQNRTRARLEETYEESLASVKETFDMSMEDIALRDEEAERQAQIRHDEIVGALEAQREELLS